MGAQGSLRANHVHSWHGHGRASSPAHRVWPLMGVALEEDRLQRPMLTPSPEKPRLPQAGYAPQASQADTGANGGSDRWP